MLYNLTDVNQIAQFSRSYVRSRFPLKPPVTKRRGRSFWWSKTRRLRPHASIICCNETAIVVEVAPDGQSALELIAERKPALVLSDIVMPVMDGYEMCRQIKGQLAMAEVNVILLTSLWDASDIVKGLQSGADYYLTKPYEDEFLLATLKNALAQPAPKNPEEPEIEINLNEQSYLISSTRLQMLHPAAFNLWQRGAAEPAVNRIAARVEFGQLALGGAAGANQSSRAANCARPTRACSTRPRATA